MKVKKTRLVLLVGLALYSGVYLTVSRYSMGVMRSERMEGFYYAPVGVEKISTNRFWQTIHNVGTIAFYPAWLVDHALGGPHWNYLPMKEIGSP